MEEQELNMMPPTDYEGPAIVALMGGRNLAGRVSTVRQFGSYVCKVEVPAVIGSSGFVRYYTLNAIYCIKPVAANEMIAAAQTYSEQRLPAAVARRLDPAYGGKE